MPTIDRRKHVPEKTVLNNVMASDENSMNKNQTSGYMMTAAPNLLALPDDVLLVIMSYLAPVDLLSVARLSARLEQLSQDRTLWTVVDTRSSRLTLPELTTIVEQLRPTTHMLAARGFVGDEPESVCISPGLLVRICNQCPALDTLILEDQYAEIKQTKKQGVPKQIHLRLFPKTLTTLSFKGCDFQIKNHHESFFHDINVHLPLLKVLILSGCSWVYPHDFIPIGKCHKLEELRMNGCHRLGECVAYTSLAARFGFPSLKILDLRDTNMGDSDVTCFNRTASLTHLYLECPSNPKHHMNNLSGFFDARYGWTEYVFPEGSPIIVINRLEHIADRCVQPAQSQRDNNQNNEVSSTTAALPGPSSGTAEVLTEPAGCIRMIEDTDTVVTFSSNMSSPGPSSTTERCQKRKTECATSGSKRVKRENQNDHFEEEPEEVLNIKVGPSNANMTRTEENNDNSSDSSDDSDSDNVVCMLRGKKCMRMPKNCKDHCQREENSDEIPGPEPIISDLCVMSFAERSSVQNNQNGGAVGMGRGVVNGSNLWYVRLMYPELGGGRPNLQTLVLRNFSRITDQSLRFLTEHSSLRYLDVSGTSVTESAVLDFKLRRPEVEVISDFDVPF